MVRKFTIRAAGVGCWMMLSSCIQVAIDSVGTKVIHERKDESVLVWKERKVGEPRAFDYMMSRTAAIFGGASEFDFGIRGGSITVKAHSRKDLTVGSAAAVSEDGYYLTAAHCLNEGGLKLVGFDGKQIFVSLDVRTVWSGKDFGQDLALIHVAAKNLPHFSLADAGEVRSGEEVLAAGLGGLKLSQSAGKILKVRTRKEGNAASWRLVTHSAPLLKGDSGGPVMNQAGKIVGITSTGGAFAISLPARKRVYSYRSGAVWADPGFIQRLIAEDRAKGHRPGFSFTMEKRKEQTESQR